MPPVGKYKRRFFADLADCRTLYRHCLAPRGQHSDAGAEAAFLQLFKAWEGLLEDCTVAFMCGRLRCNGTLVRCHVTATNEEQARRVVYQEKTYVEWTDVDKIIIRWSSIFGDSNDLEAAVRPARTELRHMRTVRNAIAHSSLRATRQFRDLVQGQFGGKRNLSRPAELLVAQFPADPARTYFDRYADVLEVAAGSLTG